MPSDKEQPIAPSQSEPRRERRPGVRFTVEFGDDWGRNFEILSLPGVNVRGEWSKTRMENRTIDTEKNRGRPVGGPPSGDFANQLPSSIPGERLTVDWQAGTVTIFDPLGLPEFAGTLRQMERAGHANVRLASDQRLSVPQPREFNADDDTLKTLCLELAAMIGRNECKVIEGTLPTGDSLSRLPGDELYEPRSDAEDKPRYKKDVAEWRRNRRAAKLMLGGRE